MPFETHYSRFSPPRPQDTTGEVRNPAWRRNLRKQLTKPEKNEEECGGLADWKGSIKAAHLDEREEIAAAANTDVLMIQLMFIVIDLHLCGVNPT